MRSGGNEMRFCTIETILHSMGCSGLNGCLFTSLIGALFGFSQIVQRILKANIVHIGDENCKVEIKYCFQLKKKNKANYRNYEMLVKNRPVRD